MIYAEQLVREKEFLESQLRQIAKKLESMPTGRLICRKQRDIYRYYRKDIPQKGSDKKTNEHYLSLNDPDLLNLAKRDYFLTYRKDLLQELKAINQYLLLHKEESAIQKYLELHPGIRQLLTPLLISKKNKYYEWATNVKYPLNPSHPEHLIYVTDAGFYVRSKSEQMMANMFLEAGIPFRYEDPVEGENGILLHPDFHLFSLRNYKEWYLDHNGMMLSEEYYMKYIRRLSELRKVGIIPGVNLLQTFEAEGHPLEPAEIRSLINVYLK